MEKITKEEFIELLSDYREHEELVDDLDKIFPCAWESKLFTYYHKLFDKIEKIYFTEEGIDWIDYYLYENEEGKYYIDGKEYPLRSLNDLWNLVEKYRK